jgi:hypothetical protein
VEGATSIANYPLFEGKSQRILSQGFINPSFGINPMYSLFHVIFSVFTTFSYFFTAEKHICGVTIGYRPIIVSQ